MRNTHALPSRNSYRQLLRISLLAFSFGLALPAAEKAPLGRYSAGTDHAEPSPQLGNPAAANPLAGVTPPSRTPASPWIGVFVTADQAITIELRSQGSGLVGRLTLRTPAGVEQMPVELRVGKDKNKALEGHFGKAPQEFPLHLRFAERDAVVMRSGAYRHELRKRVPRPPSGRKQETAVSAASARNVAINSVALDARALALLEGDSGLTIPDGHYWYDPICGAAGLLGGPTVGFLPPGLSLGGPLQEDASNGTTGVFGRALLLEVILPAELFGRIQIGTKANASFPGISQDLTAETEVARADRVTDAASNTFTVRLEISNRDGRIPAGVKCRVQFND